VLLPRAHIDCGEAHIGYLPSCGADGSCGARRRATLILNPNGGFLQNGVTNGNGGGRVKSTNLREPMAGHSAVIAQLGAAIQAHSLGALLVDVDSLTATLDHNFTPCWI